MKIGLIGGSGIYDPKVFGKAEIIAVETPYGDVKVYKGYVDDIEVYFIPRHGEKHQYPPHKVMYKANIYAFKSLGIERILSTNSVGAINTKLKPGTIVVPSNLIDFTLRGDTFYDNETVHIDITEPFCKEVRTAIILSCIDLGIEFYPRGTYVCTHGPRFETSAEIKMFKKLGCDIVGMTIYPEVSLARELEMCYASICTVTNFAAGYQDKLTAKEVIDIVKRNEEKLKRLIAESIKRIPKERNCSCAKILKDAKL